jgi:hypothetical protein
MVWMPFHAGNQGSTPCGDAKTGKGPCIIDWPFSYFNGFGNAFYPLQRYNNKHLGQAVPPPYFFPDCLMIS